MTLFVIYYVNVVGLGFAMLVVAANEVSPYLGATSVLTVPAGYLLSAVTPWVRRSRAVRVIATPLLGLALGFVGMIAMIVIDGL